MDRRTFLAATGTGATALTLGAVTTPAMSAPATTASRARAVHASDTPLLRRWFRDTYHSIEAMTTDIGLAADKINLDAPGGPVPSQNTSPTNIGCGLWSTVAAAGLGVIDQDTMRHAARTDRHGRREARTAPRFLAQLVRRP